MNKAIKAPVELDVPLIPNFIRLKNADACVSIADLDEEILREIGRQWTEKLVASALRKRGPAR